MNYDARIYLTSMSCTWYCQEDENFNTHFKTRRGCSGYELWGEGGVIQTRGMLF